MDTTEQGIYQRLQGAAESLEEGSYVMMKPLCIHYSRLGPDKEFNYLEEWPGPAGVLEKSLWQKWAERFGGEKELKAMNREGISITQRRLEDVYVGSGWGEPGDGVECANLGNSEIAMQFLYSFLGLL